MTGSTVHKYLGRHIPGDLKTRGELEFAHRLAAAWGKFHKHRTTLLNKHVSIKLRLKLFEAVVTPTVLFGLSTLPISKAQLAQLDVVQRKMLRSIAGWVRYRNEEWADTMRRVNAKVVRALNEYPLHIWSRQFACRQFWLARRLADNVGTWPMRLAKWCPSSFSDDQLNPGRFR